MPRVSTGPKMTQRTAIPMTMEMLQRVRTIAERQNRSNSYIMRQAIESWLNVEEQKEAKAT